MSKNTPIATSQQRLIELMNTMNIRQTDICSRTGLKKSSISNYVNGKRTPDREAIFLISQSYGLNPAWLMGYDVEMYETEEVKQAVDDLTAKIETIDGKALELLLDFKNLNNNGKREILRYAKYLQTVEEFTEE